MDERELKIIEHMSATLDEVLSVLRRPESGFIRVMEIGALVVTLLSFLSIVDIIRTWIFGG
ncbi:hypothetical protein FACS1894137_02030 [Spirochaetia bacterium]|nr:hypothetical protein FACS1894137_02030 [Spirochaetia bacterium]